MRKRIDPLIQQEKAILIALSLGFLMIMLDVTAVSVVLPDMEVSLNDGVIGLEWVMDSYNYAFACFLLMAGQLTKRFQAKPIFLIGISLFMITSLGSGMSPSIKMMIVCRFLQGVAAALILPSSVTIISVNDNHIKKRALTIGIWSSIAGIGAALGPIIGAYLNTAFGWRTIFLINIPIGIIAFKICFHQTLSTPLSFHKMDVKGQMVGMLSIGLLVFSILNANRPTHSYVAMLASFTLFLLTGILLFKIEQKSTSPMLSLQLFKSREFSLAMALGMIINIVYFGELFQLALYFKSRGYTTFLTGLAILSLTGSSPFASYLSGKMSSKFGPKKLIKAGLWIGTLAFFSFSLLVDEQSPDYLALSVAILATGFSCMFIVTSATIMLTQSVPNQQIGLATALFFTIRQLGSLIGVTLFGVVIMGSPSLMAGIKNNLIIAGVLFLILSLSLSNRSRKTDPR